VHFDDMTVLTRQSSVMGVVDARCYVTSVQTLRAARVVSLLSGCAPSINRSRRLPSNKDSGNSMEEINVCPIVSYPLSAYRDSVGQNDYHWQAATVAVGQREEILYCRCMRAGRANVPSDTGLHC